MIIGFSGTRKGLTTLQRYGLDLLLQYLPATALHHGDCKGSDASAHFFAGRLGVPIVIHPPDKDSLRAFCHAPPAVSILAPLPYLERNRAMVDASDVLLATPETAAEEWRSGTWATIRYARKTGKRVIVIEPDGTVRDSAKEPQ